MVADRCSTLTHKLAERYHKGALRTRVKAVAHEDTEPLWSHSKRHSAVHGCQHHAQQQDNTAGFFNITTARQGINFSERTTYQELCRFLIGNKSSSGGEGIFR